MHDWSLGEKASFGAVDYVVFGSMLVASLAIGIYYAVKSRNKANEEFLMGGRSLTFFPVSMSLLASYISAILVLGELGCWWRERKCSLCINVCLFVCVCVCKIPYLPIFHIRCLSIYHSTYVPVCLFIKKIVYPSHLA